MNEYLRPGGVDKEHYENAYEHLNNTAKKIHGRHP